MGPKRRRTNFHHRRCCFLNCQIQRFINKQPNRITSPPSTASSPRTAPQQYHNSCPVHGPCESSSATPPAAPTTAPTGHPACAAQKTAARSGRGWGRARTRAGRGRGAARPPCARSAARAAAGSARTARRRRRGTRTRCCASPSSAPARLPTSCASRAARTPPLMLTSSWRWTRSAGGGARGRRVRARRLGGRGR